MTQLNETAQNWSALPVGSIVTKLPAAATLFRTEKIDFCCGGHRLLRDVLAESGRTADALQSGLEALAAEAARVAGETDHATMPDARLAAHIDQKHHTYMHKALPFVGRLSETVLKAHGRNHPELFKVHTLYGKLRAELEQHLIKEEVSLFPLYGQSEADSSAHMGAVIRELRAEHEAAGGLLKELRTLTND